MNVIPINNSYRHNNAVYNTSPVKNISFNGLFSKSLQDKFNDGIAALDENSVFIFGPEKEKESVLYQFNQFADKINIPILKTYTYIAPKDEMPKYEDDNSFAIYKNKEKYYIVSLKKLFGLYVGNPKAELDELRVLPGETKELKPGYEIIINEGFFKNKESVVFEFNPPKSYNPKEAEKYMEVKSRFDNQDTLSRFNKATAQIISKPKNDTNTVERKFTFADVGGLDEQIEELRKYVLRPVNYPEVYENIRLNKGILMYGPPRCGKTLLGKALASEAGMKYTYLNANEFIQSEVGHSESNIRSAFDRLLSEPAILFIDEFDAIAMKRSTGSNARYQNPVVNQLLGCMSDLEKSYTNSFVIAATNRPDLIDDALLASGRFGLHLEIPMPNEESLSHIYDIHSKNQPMGSDVCKPEIVKLMFENKFNGSDVAEMIMTGYMNALERLGMNKKMDAKLFRFEDKKSIFISKADLENAIKKLSLQKK